MLWCNPPHVVNFDDCQVAISNYLIEVEMESFILTEDDIAIEIFNSSY